MAEKMGTRMLDRDSVLNALRDVGGLPQYRKLIIRRTIYEAGAGPRLRPSGCFYIDFASYPGGTTDEVPRAVIDELEREGLIQRAYPEAPQVNAWVLGKE